MASVVIIIMSVILIIAVVRAHFIGKENHQLSEQNKILKEIDSVANGLFVEYRYVISPTAYGFVVLKIDDRLPDISVVIKTFTDEDRDYALRCAEELCDKLNEKI